MKICTLASGSTGNCTYVETKNYKCLIDIGKNKKYIVEKLKEIDVDYKDIDYIFLTHTHDDHTSALKTFIKNHKATLVISDKMFKELTNLNDLEHIIVYEEHPNIDNLDIKAYKMSHDVADIRSFMISEEGKTIVYITDTGYINGKYFKIFSNKDIYFIESNHDIEMLRHGPYPEWLQRRVLSDVGHLSNEFSGIYLSKMIGDNTKHLVLLHLSEKNNTEELAVHTVKKQLADIDFKKVSLEVSKPNERTKVYEL